ncbi:photosystem I assembly protein Ycf3 [mine drainage metagenome]|uniref:protein O-GlcNAc transferase n=1 Tax=mine drainage metagenome TaxID=410659 RepID=A0A1J5S6N5_9ZZZZ
MVVKSKDSGMPTSGQINALASLFNQGRLEESELLALEMTRRYPKHGFGWKVLGAIHQQQGLIDGAFQALKMAAEFLPNDSEVQYNLGNSFYDQHLLPEAVSCYRKAVKLDSGFAMAHYNLGSVLKDQGLFAKAIVSYKKALSISPEHAAMNFNLALMLYEQADYIGAIEYYQRGLLLQPDFVMAYVILGASYKAVGELHKAEASYRNALSLDPNCFDAHNNLGVILSAMGDIVEAESCYRTAIKLEPNFASAYNNLGVLFKDQGRNVEAESYFIASLEKDPLYFLAHNNLAVTYRDQGRLSESELSCRNAIKVKPDYAEAYSNLGLALDGMGRLQEAVSAFEKALEYDPENAAMLSNFSVTLNTLSQLTRAEAYLKKALELAPEFVNAHVNLCVNYLAQGRIHDAEAICLKALKIQPDNAEAQNNLLFLMNYSDSYSANDCFEAASQYGLMVAEKADASFSSWRCESQPKLLRIGLVSGDLRQHAVSYFLENLVKHIEPSSLELIAYSTNARQDEVTARLKPYFSGWTSLVGISDKAAAQFIHNDGVHLLLDLSGHSAGNRLPIFAWKPAPVQVSWLGYFATTGVKAIDYFIADEVGVPKCNKSQFVERIKYLPDTRLCFTAPDAEVVVSALPALANGYVTFGCFQNMAKVGDDVLDLWAEVMRGVPHSKLRWQCKSFRDASVAEGLKKRLLKRGIQPDRIILLGSTLREAYFYAHAEVDMMLDTFPFTGGTTTCEALWMGVPTLTLAGSTLIARQGASLMSAAGLADWVAESKDEYVKKALFFAGDLSKLVYLRAGLRQQVLTSPLFDASRFARNMENVLWEMWRDCEAQPEMSQALTQHIAKAQLDQIQVHIEIISATRYSEDDFWSKSALGLSLKRHLKQDARLTANIAFENTRGLAEIFNECIDQAQDKDILVFIHDDVWIDDVNFAEAVIAGLEDFDVIGVAGNRRRVPNQPAWAFTEIKDGKFVTDVRSNLSGCVSHGDSAFGPESYFGELPAECELMDGVFLATKKECLKARNVGFDVQFDFHFYDLDFCRSARKAGLRLGTWLIKLTHQSQGAFGSQHWINKYQLYLNKWEETSSNNGIIFLQQLVNEREQDLQQAMSEVLQMAVEHQNAGRIEQAEQLYIEILSIHPEHALANHNLGVIEANTKGALVALPRLEIAVKASPDSEQFWVSYIDALMQSGAPDTAADAIELGQKFGLTNETAQMLAAEYVASLESQHKYEADVKVKRKAREHLLAHQLLDGLQGLEIGGAAHNAFGLNTRNVDYTAEMNTEFKLYEVSVCGEAMAVDVVAKGDDIPLPDKSVDFVISSHVIEHFFDPIKAIKEWMRLSRKYVFIIAPLPDALPSDRGKPLTTMQELLDRHSGKVKMSGVETEHYSIWTCETFKDMCLELIGDYGFHISHFEVVDTKVGNGFTVVLRHNSLVETEQDLQRSMSEMLQMALQYQNSGQIEQAKHLYLKVINIQPNHADANHNLGVIEARLNGASAALTHLEIAIMAKPKSEQFWVSYIDALMQSGANDNIIVSALELGQQCGGLKIATVKMLAAERIAAENKQASFCPVCNCQQVEFLPLPDSYQEIARRHGFIHFGQGEMTSAETYTCRNCGASDRERLYALWIDQQIEKGCFSANTRVIHFAPEAVLSAKLKSIDLFDYKTADLFMDRVDYKVDMMDMPFKDARFDFFICSHVLEHVSSDDQAIQELFRITKLGGSGILMAPIIVGLEKTQEDSNVTDEESRCRLYGQNDHVRLYAHNDYVNKIRSYGFRVEELGIDYFGEEAFISLGLKPTSILYVVRK